MKQRTDTYYAIITFLITIVLATVQHWSATELIWSLWISSLVLGYAYIIISIGAMLIKGNTGSMMGRKTARLGNPPMFLQNVFFLIALIFILGFSKYTLLFLLLVASSILFNLSDEQKSKVGLGFFPSSQSFISKLIIYLPSAIFMLGFFSIHFLGFHFIHGIFLSHFFPLLQDSPFDKNMEQAVIYIFTIVRQALKRFWPFILLSAFSRFNHYLKAFTSKGSASMFIPYKNVIRMHISIFAIAFMSALNLSDYVLYFILLLYFLPVKSILRLIKTPDSEQNQNQTDLCNPNG
jgi:hypothetical protein